jgi:hypothetical protein
MQHPKGKKDPDCMTTTLPCRDRESREEMKARLYENIARVKPG